MRSALDITGSQYGFWTVIKRMNNSANGKTQWLCRCDCGTEKPINTNSLRTGNSTSCGCNNRDDLRNKRFGDIAVLHPDHSSGKRQWRCVCSCGRTFVVSAGALKSGSIKSCDHSSTPDVFNPASVKDYIRALNDMLVDSTCNKLMSMQKYGKAA